MSDEERPEPLECPDVWHVIPDGPEECPTCGDRDPLDEETQ